MYDIVWCMLPYGSYNKSKNKFNDFNICIAIIDFAVIKSLITSCEWYNGMKNHNTKISIKWNGKKKKKKS